MTAKYAPYSDNMETVEPEEEAISTAIVQSFERQNKKILSDTGMQFEALTLKAMASSKGSSGFLMIFQNPIIRGFSQMRETIRL